LLILALLIITGTFEGTTKTMEAFSMPTNAELSAYSMSIGAKYAALSSQVEAPVEEPVPMLNWIGVGIIVYLIWSGYKQ